MSRHDLALEQLREPYQRIYEALYLAAHEGRRCPTNRELARESCWPGATPRYATQAVQAIEAAGLIKVIRGHKARVVIIPSGQATHGEIEEPRHEHRSDPPRPTPPVTARAACSFCGVRSDVGCVHSRRHAA